MSGSAANLSLPFPVVVVVSGNYKNSELDDDSKLTLIFFGLVETTTNRNMMEYVLVWCRMLRGSEPGFPFIFVLEKGLCLHVMFA